MSLGIAFKGPEGLVLAADSRVTLTAEVQRGDIPMALPSAFDNATRLLPIHCHKRVGAVTYALGALGQQEPRTAHSFLPEFEDEFATAGDDAKRSVSAFAQAFSDFFMRQWHAQKMPDNYQGPEMVFLAAGFDEGAVYGSVLKFGIPYQPLPRGAASRWVRDIVGRAAGIHDALAQGLRSQGSANRARLS